MKRISEIKEEDHTLSRSQSSDNIEISTKKKKKLSDSLSDDIEVVFIKRIFGEKCATFYERFVDLLYILFRVDKNDSYLKRVKRVSMISFQIVWVVILSMFFMYESFDPYAKTGVIYTNENKEVRIGEQFPIWISFGISAMLLIIILFANVFVAKYEGLWGLLTIFTVFILIDVSLFIYPISIFVYSAHSMLVLVIWFALFTLKSVSIKIFFTIMIIVNLILLCGIDIFNKEKVIDNAIERIQDDYYTSLMISYISFYGSAGALIFFFLVRLIPEIRFLKTVTKEQQDELNKLAVIEKEIEEAFAVRKSYDNIDMAQIKINKNLFVINSKDISIVEKISGATGSKSMIYKAKWKNEIVCYKLFKIFDFLGKDKMKDFENEISILASINHPNILRFYGGVVNLPRIGIIMEYCDNLDMKKFLQAFLKRNHSSFMKYEKIRMLKEVVSAMIYLHDFRIIHRDLKPQNVLVTKNYETRLMDFGLSKFSEHSTTLKTGIVGTSFYISPEIVDGNMYTNKCDVFSFAMLAYCVITEVFNPFTEILGKNVLNLENQIANNRNLRPKYKAKDWIEIKWLYEVIATCWEHEATRRPSFKEIYESFTTHSFKGVVIDENDIEEDIKNLASDLEAKYGEEKFQKIVDAYIEIRKENQKRLGEF